MTNPFIRILATLVSAVMLLLVGAGGGKDHKVKSPDACRLNFAVLSDSHIEGNNTARYKVFAKSLRDVKRNQSGADAVVFLGDNTMNGNSMENMLFHGTVSRELKGKKILPVLGNHDIGNGEGDYAALQSRWYAYTDTFFNLKLTTPYYYDVIDGCYFIVLGTEAHTSNTMTMTDDQLAWLGFVLEDAARSGRPVFVFSHHPERSARRANPDSPYSLTDMLSEYAETHDLFYFSGHTHRTLTKSSFNTYYNFPEINLPRLTELQGEKDNEVFGGTGFGVEVEVYDTEVVVRGRNFYTGEWAADNSGPIEATYTLKNPIAH